MKFADGFGRLPIKSWIDTDELFGSDSLTSQALAVSNLPMAFHHVALMADAHAGFGMPIGGVLALDGAICPAAVGYDIGCGMLAIKTDIPAHMLRLYRTTDTRVAINRAIRKNVPVGEGGDRKTPSKYADPFQDLLRAKHDWDWSYDVNIEVSDKVTSKLESQMGTLGGGNHFIEFDYDPMSDNDDVWIVIHSGSRGVGYGIADHHMKVAQNMCSKWWSQIPKDLACLPVDSNEGRGYEIGLKFALDWALANREVMMCEVTDAVQSVIGNFNVLDRINVHHNDANLEHHFGRDVWVHRKGATRARKGDKLVIPGNMGQGTAICMGLGNPDSFCSSSHGAGRRMGRNEAKRTLDAAECKGRLDALDVVLSAGRDGALDEMPEAYKDFSVVMDAQSDLVETLHMLKPMSVIKG